MSEQIYVSLLDEGVPVWRPVPAWKVDQSTYIVLRPDSYDPDDEKWEFPPGSTVICEPRQTASGAILAAVRASHVTRRIA
jgi:hypothetical protein